MNLSETCQDINQILWTSPKLTKSFMLRIVCDDFGNKQNIETISQRLTTIQANQRRYTSLSLQSYNCRMRADLKAKLMETVRFLGPHVKQLKITLGVTSLIDLLELLREFPHVDKLTLGGFVKANLLENDRPLNIQGLLPNLNNLEVSFPNSLILELLKDVNTLKRFSFYSYDGNENLKFGITNFENFIIQQNQLKRLEVFGINKFGLFQENRIKEINFQLDSLHAICSLFHHNNAENFIKHQSSIKNFHLINFRNEIAYPDPQIYCNILRRIFTSPQLEKLTINHKSVSETNMQYIGDIRNENVKMLEFWGQSEKVFESLVKIFPNLTKIEFSTFKTNLAIPSDKLANLTMTSPGLLQTFIYEPLTMDFEREKFEENFIKFIGRHKNIFYLTIGHKGWIGTENGVSFDLVKKVLRMLENIREIEIFNPLQQTEILQILCEQNVKNTNFKSTLHL